MYKIPGCDGEASEGPRRPMTPREEELLLVVDESMAPVEMVIFESVPDPSTPPSFSILLLLLPFSASDVNKLTNKLVALIWDGFVAGTNRSLTATIDATPMVNPWLMVLVLKNMK